jgi:hypothetical protein
MKFRRTKDVLVKGFKTMKIYAVALALWVMISANTFAAEIAGITYADTHKADKTELNLVGTGLMRYLVFIKAYVAALYMEEGVPSDKVLSDVAKRLEIEYFVPIEAKDFVFSTNELTARNVDARTFARLRPRIDRINALYEDVSPGDRYSLTYIPGVGTELALNGEPKGTIEGNDFAAAVFSMWLGPRPIDESLRDSLLGKE